MPLQPLRDGRSLYFERRGFGSPLILLNGMSQSTANWLSHARSLAERFTLVMYDAQGQGQSPLGGRPVSLDGHVSDLRELVEALELESPTLCGFSYGARVALAYTARHADEVPRLVLTAAGDDDDPLRRTIVRSWRELLRIGGLEAMAWAAIPDILGREFLGGVEAHLEAMVRSTLQRNTTEGLGALLASMEAFPSPLQDASHVACPSLLISGAHDLLVSAESAERLAHSLGAEHLTIDAGHTVPVERVTEWRSAVMAFASG
jgi:3-oxoadipate enol-lactonase